jgi:hypothetical protein
MNMMRSKDPIRSRDRVSLKIGICLVAALTFCLAQSSVGKTSMGVIVLNDRTHFAQAPTGSVAPLRINLQVLGSPKDVLSYVAQKSSTLIKVVPDDARLMAAWGGIGRMLFKSFFITSLEKDMVSL